MTTREQKVAQIRRLRSRGFTNVQIAWKLGCAKSTINNLLSDPDGSKQKQRRLFRYSRPCVDCGKPTDGSCGYVCDGIPRCVQCTAILRRRWTREAIIEAIQAWAARHGRPPVAHEWIRSGPDHPASSNVYGREYAFPSWADAIEAAGFPRPPLPGLYERTESTLRKLSESRRRLDYDNLLTLARHGLTYAKIAELVGCTPHHAQQVASKHGIVRRPKKVAS